MKKKIWIVVIAVVFALLGVILELTVGEMKSAGDFAFDYFACGVFAAGKFSIGVF